MSTHTPSADDELLSVWNRVWLTANEEAQAEMFKQETLPQDFQAHINKVALRKTILAFAAAVSARGES